MRTLDIPHISADIRAYRLRVNAGWVVIQFQEYRVVIYKLTDGFDEDTEAVFPCTLS